MAFIDGHRDRWSVAAMCRVLEFSQRTYYAAKARSASSRSLADEGHKVQIRRVWENNYRVYGPAGSGSSCTGKATASAAAASSG